MSPEITKPLARVIYEAHAKSRSLKTPWQDLGGTERQHWLNVAAAVTGFWGEFGMIGDEE